MYCPNCNTQLPDDAKFCTRCGTIMSVAQPVPDYRPRGREKPAKKVKEAKERKFAPKALISMILGITAAALASVAMILTIYSLVSRSLTSSAIAFLRGLLCSIPCIPLGIVSTVMSRKREDDTQTGRTFRKVGRITGLFGLIGGAVCLATCLTIMVIIGNDAGCMANRYEYYGYYNW